MCTGSKLGRSTKPGCHLVAGDQGCHGVMTRRIGLRGQSKHCRESVRGGVTLGVLMSFVKLKANQRCCIEPGGSLSGSKKVPADKRSGSRGRMPSDNQPPLLRFPGSDRHNPQRVNEDEPQAVLNRARDVFPAQGSCPGTELSGCLDRFDGHVDVHKPR